MVFPTSQALAANKGIFFSHSTAKRLASQIDYCNKTKTNDENIIYNLDLENKNLYSLNDKYKEKITGLELDKEILKVRGDKFETEFNNCGTDLTKCMENKPSRLTWFGAGVITTLLSILALGLSR